MGLENEMFNHEQVELKVKHHFSPGVYVRELFIPAGVMLTGKIHKTEHLNIISQGTIKIIDPESEYEVSAPTTILSKPGTKRVGLAITDTVWMTVHENKSNTTDIQELENQIVVDSFDNLDKFISREDKKCLS